MNPQHLDLEELQAVYDALERRAGGIKRLTSRKWSLPMAGQQDRLLGVSVRDTGLQFEIALPYRPSGALPGHRRVCAQLAANAYLPEGTCFCMGTRSRTNYLMTYLPLYASQAGVDWLIPQVDRSFDALTAAVGKPPTQYIKDRQPIDGLDRPLTVDDESGEVARAYCQELGWGYNERGNGQLVITLDVPGQFCQAFAYATAGEEFRLGSQMAVPHDLSTTSRHAIAIFLLSASRVVRLARATIIADSVVKHYRWEVAWPQLPTEEQFNCGLTALSVACRQTQRELQALGDDSIADRYLNLRRRSPR